MSDSYVIEGRTVTMPARVRDASTGTAVYLVSSAAAQKLIPGDAFQVIEVAPGQAQLALGFVDYRDNDLGDYDEVMVVFFVRPVGIADGRDGVFIYKLPVNQWFTCAAGCEIWGFPKSVEHIDVRYRDDEVSCRLEMNGQHAFTLTLPRLSVDGVPDFDMEMTSYTYRERATELSFTQGGATAMNPGGAGVRLELGSHPLADDLRSLGLPDAPLLMSTWVEHMRGTFGAPRDLGSEG